MWSPFLIDNNNSIINPENILNIFLLLFTYFLTINLYGKTIDYIIILIFTSLQIIICSLMETSCNGVSIIWNSLLGYLLIKSIKDKSISIIILCILLSFSNLYFYNYEFKSHIAHLLAFLIGYIAGFLTYKNTSNNI